MSLSDRASLRSPQEEIQDFFFASKQGLSKVWKPLNISQTVHSRKKCFRQKLFGFEGAIRWYHWFDLEESFEGHVKVTSIFLNGTPYIFLQILVAYLDSFPKHYN